MTLFLRDQNNDTIVDLDYWKKDGLLEISCSVDIIHYSTKLMEMLKTKEVLPQSTTIFIADIDRLSEMRGWLNESYFMGRKNTDKEYDTVLKMLKTEFKSMAKIHNLLFVED